jgi:NhaA family Na+:H+ antiporter
MTTHVLLHPAALAPGRHTAAGLFHFTIEHFLLLPIGGFIALLWANLGPESYFTFSHNASFVVNEVGMAVFFALITQQIVEEVMPGGALHTWRRWTVPAVAAAGGTLGAAAVYMAYVGLKYELVLSPGWPAAAAIDIAFGYFIVKAIFGRHAAIPFLLLAAIVADALGMLAIAGRQAFVEVRPGGAALMAIAVGLAFMFRQLRVRTFWPYLAICGPMSWWALHLDGFHPALALVPIVPFLPHVARSLDGFAETPDRRHDSVRHFEHLSQYPVQAVLFLFGLVNAGVLLSGYGTGTWALLWAAVIGKPLGILAATGLAVALGLHLPVRLHWRDLVVVALATSGGFTFGLFFATAVFPVGPVLAELKIGAVATGIGVPLAFAAAWLLHVGRFGRHTHHGRPAPGSVRSAMRHISISIVVVALFAATASGAAQQVRPSDETVARSVMERLTAHDVSGVTVSVKSLIVTLGGTVPTLWMKNRAIEEAWRVREIVTVVDQVSVAPGGSDEELAALVASRLRRYAFLTIFDGAEVEVDEGVVTLTGRVTLPYKADAFADLASRVPGVQEVRNKIKSLPVSRFDDQVRYAVAREIYGDELFARYALQANPPIHILVEHGHVTLTGVVFSEVERRKAESLARGTFAVMSVTNELRIEREE